MIPTWILALGVAVLVLGGAYGVRNKRLIGFEAELGVRPTLWWYVDDSQVNSREWLDFGNRSTREPNEPYLKICQARAISKWGDAFTVTPVIGRTAALAGLRAASADIPEGAELCPPFLWMAWYRAAALRWLGGLWMDGSVIPLGSGDELLGRVAGSDTLTFGSDPAESLSASNGVAGPYGSPTGSAAAAGPSAGWSASPGHPVWRAVERDLAALIASGPASWSSVDARMEMRTIWDKHFSGLVRVDRTAEVSRDRYGVRLELDTLLGETDWPTGSKEGGLWVPLPDGRDGLERASPYLWFTRMSVEQLQVAPFVWARWATKQ